mgnify:FL=1
MSEYKTILLKISGETFEGAKGAIDIDSVKAIAEQLNRVRKLGVRLGVVVGGGNFWRGRSAQGLERATADGIGMLATVMNASALGSVMSDMGIPNKVVSAVPVEKVADRYYLPEIKSFLNDGIVVFGGGTGSPFFSTDTAAVLRACEICADAVVCSKAVDGIYDKDPITHADAVKFDEISYDEVIAKNLKAMDLTAIAMAKEFGITLLVYGKNEPDGLIRVLKGEKLGTIVK